MLAELGRVLAPLGGADADPRLKAIVFEGAGAHFCFGASVAEHTRERAPGMLRQFHALFRRLAALSVPTVAVVRGACLGGGLELASWCSFVFASPEATFGQPEIKLGVFPPMASLILPWRLGGGRALDLCVSGRTIGAELAHAWGLVHQVAADPAQAATRFIADELEPRSGSSLRFAERAARRALIGALDDALPALERLYLDELMATPDANEGITAFLEKRPARWTGQP
jgi:cyclohexa-1,5-dienecarbonyl-CoA hydratase